MPKFLVETVSIFRMRYLVEAECAEYANDAVTMADSDFNEFSQKHLDEIITSTREVSNEEALNVFNEDNKYLSSWSDEDKLSRLTNKA